MERTGLKTMTTTSRQSREVPELGKNAKLGFVGLGRMGGAMATRLLAAGLPVYGTSRTREHADALVTGGLLWRDTPRAVAEAAEIVFSSIPDDRALNEVAAGPDGILAGLAAGKVWVEMSTVSPRASKHVATRVRDREAAMLDAPVSGSVPQAQAGTLTIMVGGDDHAYARVEPILRELGRPNHIGPNGHGLVVKLAINVSLAVQMLAFAEGLVLAERAGVDRERALGVMLQSPIASPSLKARADTIFDLPDEAWFDLDLMHKDLRLALDEAADVRAMLPAADSAEQTLTVAHALGYGKRDLAALFHVLEQLAEGREAA